MAIDHYEKFLYLWKDADPIIPEDEDGKKKRDCQKPLDDTILVPFQHIYYAPLQSCCKQFNIIIFPDIPFYIILDSNRTDVFLQSH